MTILNAILLIIAILLAIPFITFFVECLASLLPKGKDKTNINTERPKTTILVPAHNEAEDIEATVENVLGQITPQDRLVVIADNCKDNTAELARNKGAEVIERSHDTLKGKGYALAYAMNIIKEQPPEVLVILDGDCVVSENGIENITRLARDTNRPVQSTYMMKQPDDTSIKDRISTFALRIKNEVRLTGLKRLGRHCLLTGSGMAFPWSIISKIDLSGSKTTDDTQLTVDLVLNDESPIFCDDAMVMGRLMKGKAAQSQKSRWEHGQLEMILVEIPKLLKAFIKKPRLLLVLLALDLSIPPLSLLIMTWLVATTVCGLATIFGVSTIPFAILSFCGILLFLSVLISWAKFGYQDVPLKDLIIAPFYVLSKIPIYINFILKPQSRWLKTERD